MLNLTGKKRRLLVDKMVAMLPSLHVYHGFLLDGASHFALRELDSLTWSHKTNAQNELATAKAALTDMIDDYPIAEFAEDFLHQVLSEHFDPDTTVTEASQLGEVLQGVDVSEIANALLDALERLPHQYTFSMPLNDPLGALLDLDHGNLEIVPGLRLLRVDREFWATFAKTQPLKSSVKIGGLGGLGGISLSQADTRDFDLGTAVLQVEKVGYLKTYRSTGTFVDAVSTMKSFFGLCLALKVVAQSYGALERAQKEHLTFHRTDGSGIPGDRQLDHDAAELLRILRAQMYLNGPSSQAGEALKLLRASLSGHPDAARLKLAGRWLFDSWASGDDLTAFVQGTITLEILVGEQSPAERKGIGFGELLATRCAYLLGRTLEERDSIDGTIKRIYKVRVAIVHNGQPRLSSDQRALLSILREYCARIIFAEARVLAASNPA